MPASHYGRSSGIVVTDPCAGGSATPGGTSTTPQTISHYGRSPGILSKPVGTAATPPVTPSTTPQTISHYGRSPGIMVQKPCTSCTCGITDSFTRTVDVDHLWGSLPLTPADCGVEWNVTDSNVGSTLSWEANVTGGYGRLWSQANDGSGNGADPQARLQFIGIGQTFVIAFRVNFVSFNTSWASQNVTFSVISDSGDAHVEFTMGDGIYLVSLGTSGTSRVAFVPDANAWYHVRFEQDANSELRMKIWLVGDSEPGSWTLTRNVSGQTAWAGSTEFRINLDQLNATVAESLEVHVDDLDIDGVTGCMFDNFERTESGTWGDATPSAYTWTAGGSGSLDVASGGILAPADFAQRYAEVTETGGLWWRATEFTMIVVWKISALGTPANLSLVSSPTYSGVQLDLYTGGSQRLWIGSTDYVPDPWVADTWYFVKWHHTAAIDEAKVWKDGDAEPAAYQVSEVGGPALLDDTFGIYAYNDATKTFTIDYIQFSTCPVP